MLVYIEEEEQWYNSADAGILLHLSPQDKRQIENMPPQHQRYLSVPHGTSRVKMNSLLQTEPPVEGIRRGLDDLNIDGVASAGGDDD